MAVKRLGLLGGAFDPPHLAHLALAQTAVTQLQLDELHILPTGQAWHKPRQLTAPEHRLAMVQLAFAGLMQAQVDDRETRRQGPSYTIETLHELLAESPGAECFLIIGADQARALPTWRHWREILATATICVADRPPSTGAQETFEAEIAYPERFFHLQMPTIDISATEIRARVGAHQNVTALVGEPVARYIADHHLYQIP